MLAGEFHHTISHQGRLVIPAKFRRQLGEAVAIVAVSDNHLAVYPSHVSLGASTILTAVDRQGRIRLPEKMRKRLSPPGKMDIRGVYDHVEVVVR